MQTNRLKDKNIGQEIYIKKKKRPTKKNTRIKEKHRKMDLN